VPGLALFRHEKLRYRGLAKNIAQLRTLFCAGQPGDRQENPARAGLIIPGDLS
jgi:hypothetical protein